MQGNLRICKRLWLMNLKLISVDIFQTLVDVSSIQEQIWRIFLKEDYTLTLCSKGGDLASEKILDYFSKHIAETSTFMSVKSIFSLCYSEVFDEMDIDFDPEKAASITAYHHNLAEPFNDAEDFLSYVKDKYTYCISSDADTDMIEGLDILKDSDRIFTSEDLKTYKMSQENVFFQTILDHYAIQPEEMIHIGDSPADIVNPKRLGIKTCWINRNNSVWQNDIEPDIIFKSLEPLAGLL